MDQGHVFAERTGLDREPACLRALRRRLARCCRSQWCRPGRCVHGTATAPTVAPPRTCRAPPPASPEASSTTCGASSAAATRPSSWSPARCSPAATCSIEDVPGSGKTTLARAFAAASADPSTACRAPPTCCPPTSPGSGVWDSDDRSFRFVPGPVFANVVLVDELNRLAPRTQSAFLEAMEESAGHRRRAPPRAARPVLRRRHPEPVGAVRHLPAARGPGRPVRRRADPRPARRRRPSTRSCASSSPARPSTSCTRSSPPSSSSSARAHPGHPRLRPRARPRARPGARHPR